MSSLRKSLSTKSSNDLSSPEIINKHLSSVLEESGNHTFNKSLDRDAVRRRRSSRGWNKVLQLNSVEKQNDISKVQLSEDEIVQHYAQCMKLSAENKINQKNAFNLHFIDHMKNFIYKDGTTNFLVAGGAIYAGAKIYASRVDAVDTMLNRLIASIPDNKPENIENQNSGDSPTEIPKKKKKKSKQKVLETKDSNLRLSSIPSFTIDELNIQRQNLIDASSGAYLNGNILKLAENEVMLNYIDNLSLQPVTEVIESENESLITILNKGKYWNDLKRNRSKMICGNSLDIENVTESISTEIVHEFKSQGMDLDAACIEAESDEMDVGSFCDDNLSTGFDQILNSPSNHKQSDEHDVFSRLSAFISTGEFSFFKPEVLSTFKCPEKWSKFWSSRRINSKNEKKEDENNFKKPTRRKKSEKTGVILLTEFQNDSKIRSQTISKQKLNQFVEDKNSLIQIERSTIIKENLLKALTAEVIVKASRVSQIGNCDIEETELVKTVCRENMDYCPPVEAFDGDDDDDADDLQTSGYHFDSNMANQTINFYDEDYQNMIKGDHLVEGPQKINHFSLNVNQNFSKVNVKKLKEAIWEDLKVTDNEKKANKSKDETHELKFSETFNNLPKKVSSDVVGSLSFPDAFTSLLQLCNEKNLHLSSVSSLDDIIITLPT